MGIFVKKIAKLLRLCWNRIFYVLTRPYYTIKFSYLVWLYVVNRDGYKKWKQYKVEYNKVQKRIMHDLKTQGFAVTHVDELFPGEDRLPALRKYVEAALPTAQERHKKKFLKKLWEEEPPLDPSNPFMALGYAQKVLEIVGGYLEVFPHITSFWLDVTVPIERGTEEKQSQCWHRDPGEKKMCKLFLYVNDVDTTSGPFTYAAYSHYGGRYRHVFPQKLPSGCYPPAEMVEKRILREDIRELTGRAGTVIFADTTGLHKGGYATDKERIMFTSCYTTEMTRSGRGFQSYYHTDAFKKQYSTLHPLAQYALQE